MAYVKNTWIDQKVQRPKTYNFTTNDDGSTTLIDAFGNVEELGTPVNADNMNHIEDGLANVGIWTYSATVEYNKDDAVIGIVDNELVLYKSKQDKNKGNALTNTDYWEEVKLGGGSGLEVCDIGMALYVDETKGLRRYLNGQIVDINTNTQKFLDRLKEITTLHPSLLCTEEEWQTAKTMSAFGQVGKFVFNYSGETVVSVRIPRVVNVQGLFDLQNLGMTVEAGLPNITGTIQFSRSIVGELSGFVGITQQGIFDQTSSQSGGRTISAIDFDASRSSPIYGNSNTVQQEAIQYPYFIQIATGSETEVNIVNTLENVNGFTLLESKYSDKPLYNESWLLSNGQWNAKAVYPTVYEGLQVEYNTEIEAGTTVTLPSGVSYTKRGLSVKLSTEVYTDYDFVLNTADETFRLPLKTKLASGNAVVGNGMTLGLTNGTQLGGLQEENDNTIRVRMNAYGKPIGTSWQEGNMYDKTLGITTDPTKSGLELSDSGLYLYFYVGNLDQNHGIVNMGRIGEQLASLITVVETYQNGASWYRVYSDGWCEQGGKPVGTNSSQISVNLLKPYKDTNYTILNGFANTSGTSVKNDPIVINNITTSGFAMVIQTSAQMYLFWQACGYIA